MKMTLQYNLPDEVDVNINGEDMRAHPNKYAGLDDNGNKVYEITLKPTDTAFEIVSEFASVDVKFDLKTRKLYITYY